MQACLGICQHYVTDRSGTARGHQALGNLFLTQQRLQTGHRDVQILILYVSLNHLHGTRRTRATAAHTGDVCAKAVGDVEQVLILGVINPGGGQLISDVSFPTALWSNTSSTLPCVHRP